MMREILIIFLEATNIYFLIRQPAQKLSLFNIL